jgi:hypothetical protein
VIAGRQPETGVEYFPTDRSSESVLITRTSLYSLSRGRPRGPLDPEVARRIRRLFEESPDSLIDDEVFIHLAPKLRATHRFAKRVFHAVHEMLLRDRRLAFSRGGLCQGAVMEQ